VKPFTSSLAPAALALLRRPSRRSPDTRRRAGSVPLRSSYRPRTLATAAEASRRYRSVGLAHVVRSTLPQRSPLTSTISTTARFPSPSPARKVEPTGTSGALLASLEPGPQLKSTDTSYGPARRSAMSTKALCASPRLSLARAPEPAPRHHRGPSGRAPVALAQTIASVAAAAQEGEHVLPWYPRVGRHDIGMVRGSGDGRGDDGSGHVACDIGTDRKRLPEFFRQKGGQISQSLLRYPCMKHQ
jgi:hypothetical protein